MLKILQPAATAIVMSMSVSLYALDLDNFSDTRFKEAVPGVEIDLSVPVAASADGKALKEWTIMVFINGKNNLEKYALRDMNEMEMIGSSDKVNIVVEIGRMAGYSDADGDWTGSRRYLVRKDADMDAITSPVLYDLGKTDMGDYKQAVRFGKWAKANYPARKYMFIIGNHGSGWIKGRAGLAKGISYDYETGNHMNTQQLALLLKGIGGVDVYASDACLMQMPSVAYEIRSYTRYIVGSEDVEPETGYAYDALLGAIVDDPGMTPEEAGRQAVNAYSDNYLYQNATHSLLKSSALDGLAGLVNDFVAAAKSAGEKALVKDALYTAQSYEFYENKDLWDFIGLYSDFSASREVKSKAAALRDYLTSTLVVHNMTSGIYADRSKGLAVYMPETSLDSAYTGLAWAKATQWDEFIKWYQTKNDGPER